MNNILNILKKELKELFRDKKSLTMMLIIPIFIPLVVIGFSALFDSEQNVDINEYNKIGFNYELSEDEKNIADSMQIEVISKDVYFSDLGVDILSKSIPNSNLDFVKANKNKDKVEQYLRMINYELPKAEFYRK